MPVKDNHHDEYSLTLTSSKLGNSEQRPRQLKGFEMPMLVRPTQYVMSTIRANSSNSLNSCGETALLLDPSCCATGICNEGEPKDA